MRICVVGYSGSGKSSFATKLAEHYNIEPTYGDKLHFESNWVVRDQKIRDQMLEDVMERDQWVIDGNYMKVVTKRFLLADQIFMFNFNRIKCLYGVILRRIKYRHKTRRSMTEGNKEKLDLEFILWVLFHSRSKKRRAFYHSLKEMYPDKFIEFKHRRDVNRYLKSIGIYDFKEKA